jgi:AraC family transcriptional regulator
MQMPRLPTAAPSSADGDFPVHETHGIALWPVHRLLSDSRQLGWHDVYSSVAAEQPWSDTLRAVPHLCLAYCRHRPALVQRRIAGEAGSLRAELRPRLFGVVPADQDSHWSLHGTPDIQLIYLRRTMVDEVAAQALDLAPDQVALQPRLGFADPLMEQMAIELKQLMDAGQPGGDSLFADAIARLLALHLLRSHGTRAPRRTLPDMVPRVDGRIRHVCDYIESALQGNLSLARLAQEAGVAAHSFAAAFRKTTGQSPHRYVMQRRIERAKQLLRARQLPIADIALQTGFSSQSHLASAFKAATGLSPGSYRQQG